MSYIEIYRKCDFCGLERRFGSSIIINYLGEGIGKIKVCPDCRSKHSIEDLYKKLGEKNQEFDSIG